MKKYTKIIFLFLSFSIGFYSCQTDKKEEKKENVKDVLLDDPDKIVKGIHVRTGLKEAEGLMTVVNTCTLCHSADIVIGNRMNEERWNTTIKWMQETQGLWELGPNQKVIVDYLTKNYPMPKASRRANLKDIDWYVLK